MLKSWPNKRSHGDVFFAALKTRACCGRSTKQMKIISAFHLEGRGNVLITDQKVPEVDWNHYRGTKKIRVQIEDDAPLEFAVKSVELVLESGMDYLSFMIEGDFGGIDPVRFEGQIVEQNI